MESPLIVAEIGTAHLGSLDRAHSLIDSVASTGADAVKFQWVYADEILHPKTGLVTLPGGATPLFDVFRSLECPVAFYKDCCDYAHKKNLKFICSPFGQRSLRELLSISPDALKIASPELNFTQLLREVALTRGNTPLILSSGVSKLSDIEHALEIVGVGNITLLHCVTSYPAPAEDYNLTLIKTLRAIFGVPLGVSDHSREVELVPILSTLFGAVAIEKHITLSNDSSGLDDKIALNVDEFSFMVHSVRQTVAALNRYGADRAQDLTINQLKEKYSKDLINAVIGSGVKTLGKSEISNYGRTNRSIHYLHDMKAGDEVTARDVGVLRTEKVLTPGLPPDNLTFILGHHLTRDISAGDGAAFGDFFS